MGKRVASNFKGLATSLKHTERSSIHSIMSGGEKKITLKLVVVKEEKRVVFAEADKDFVDILLSFLTLPLGTIIRLLGKESAFGSMGHLYESVKNLDAKYLQTEACMTMLLRPQSAAAYQCEDLKLNIDDADPRAVFVCKKSECCAKAICLASSVAKARCPHCKQFMDIFNHQSKRDADCACSGDGVFVKGDVTFMVGDDLQVMPASLANSISLFQKSGLEDGAVLEERTIDLGTKEVLDLLNRCLISKAPLTGMCFGTGVVEGALTGELDVNNTIKIETEENPMHNEPKETISLKLLVNRANSKVLCAEAGEDFTDLVLSFLTLPLGSVIKLLNMNSSMGCVDSLYRSVQRFCLDYIKSDECREMLLSPKLAPFFGCNNHLLKIDEMSPWDGSSDGRCFICKWNGVNATKCKHGVGKAVFTHLNPKSPSGKKEPATKCKHGVGKAVFTQLNPKSPSGEKETGGGYAKGRVKFMVADDLRVSPLTPISVTELISSQGSHYSKLEERESSIDHVQALNLLRASLISKTPLCDIFCPDNKRRKIMRTSSTRRR